MTTGSVIAIHQPNYLPWLGYFYKIYESDVFVFLDDAQFSNSGMHNYTYIKSYEGTYRLKYPVQQSLGDKIFKVRPKNELGWRDKHLNIIRNFYGKAAHFNLIFRDYENLLLDDYENIAQLNSSIIRFFSKKLGLKTTFINSSDLNIDLKQEEKLIKICKFLNGKIYYSGTGAKSYQNENNFVREGIDLRYSSFKQFHYPQLGNQFEPNLSVLDFIMNNGYDWQYVIRNQSKE